jgi:antitoxin HicB
LPFDKPARRLEEFGAQTKKRRRRVKKENISSLDSLLREEGTHEQVSATAIKRVLARQVEAAMKEKHFSKAKMARTMHLSRAALDRLLDPAYDVVTVNTLRKAQVSKRATGVPRRERLSTRQAQVPALRARLLRP